MTYSKVQFIAYRICTGQGHNPDCYVGLSDEVADVRQRVKLMTEAVNAAGARSEVDRRSDVLKVFIAPEFYRSMYDAGGERVRQASVRDDLSLSTNSLFLSHFSS
jgi:hypothetical protein